MEEKRSETYWPSLQNYLKNGEVSYEDLELSCGICHDNMSVLPGQHIPDDDAESHYAAILPSFNQDSELRPVCFTCRADITHRGCTHVHPGLPMPGRLQDVDSIPPTLSEGGFVSSECGTCHVNYTYDLVKYHVDHYNKSLPDGCRRHMGFHVVSEANDCYYEVLPEGRVKGQAKFCEPPKCVKSALAIFDSDRRIWKAGKAWMQQGVLQQLDHEFVFKTWKMENWEAPPPTPKPSFQDWVDYMFLMERERAQAMTWNQLCSEYWCPLSQ
ncbi:hypothetical protein ACLX1H_010841 [Fusarium chlamydosporum]